MKTLDLERKKARIELWSKVIAIPIIGFLIAPFIFTAITGMIGAIVAGVISLGLIQFRPWVTDKFANWRLKAIKAEAAKNPIETLQYQYQDKEEALRKFKEKIGIFASKILKFKTERDTFRVKFPARAHVFDEQYTTMIQLLKLRKQKFIGAKEELARFSDKIEEMKATFEVAKAAGEMTAAAEMGGEEAFFNKIRTEAAIDSVEEAMNVAFSDLEVCLLDEQVAPRTVVQVAAKKVEQLSAGEKVSDDDEESLFRDFVSVENK